eukprot:jgi/Bigna1/134389/aug1.25_g9097
MVLCGIIRHSLQNPVALPVSGRVTAATRGGLYSPHQARRPIWVTQLRRDKAGFIVDEDLTYDTNVYCQNLGGTAQLKFTDAAQEFADKLKADPNSAALPSTLEMIDANFEYMPVRFSIGEEDVDKGDKADIAKALSFAILGGIPVTTAAKMIGSPELGEKGWNYLKFPNGLSIYPKGAAYDYNEDPNKLLEEASTISGSQDWDPNSDIWIP